MPGLLPGYDDSIFLSQVESALQEVRKVLEVTRKPEYPHDVAHEYNDKFLLCEFLVQLGLAGSANSLGEIGLTAGKVLLTV